MCRIPIDVSRFAIGGDDVAAAAAAAAKDHAETLIFYFFPASGSRVLFKT